MKKLFFLLIVFCSCAKFNYVLEQGIGQFRLYNNAVLNSKVASEYQDKVALIEKYKVFFFSYFDIPPTDIYSKTTILDSPAVTYLVTAAKYNELKLKEECFFIVGCFPYLGFFKKSSAVKYQKSLEEKGYITFLRPVYAYSSMGYFSDNILSSFFHYNDYELAELIFHELFHTIFFIKDDVKMSENLASYFGEELAILYFKKNREDKKRKLNEQRKEKQKIVNLIRELSSRYKENMSKEEAGQVLKNFLEKDFYPNVKLKREWNNASFAEFLLYEDFFDKIEEERNNMSLLEFYKYLKVKYKK